MQNDDLRISPSNLEPADTDRQEQELMRPRSHSGERKRSRSVSPPGEDRPEKKPKRKDAGFKWKDKRRDDDDQQRDREEGLRRGYRDPYKPKQRSRERQRSRSPRRRDHDGRGRDRELNQDGNQDRDRHRIHNPRDKYGREDRPRRDDSYRDRGRSDRDRNPKPEKKAPAAPSMPQQEMILVTVNDRLGTKKQVPCLPSDTVKDFKAVVAMMIGRRPHEILLKRQSERPFKDFLTLQDYGVSNNVQLDLEVDTGD